MPRAWSPCPTPGCPEVTPPGQGRCQDCKAEAEQRRGTAKQRGYGKAHRSRFREGVLARDCYCVCRGCDSHAGLCAKPSTVADHHPLSRRELVAQGMDPDNPNNGRGLCESCHNKSTAKLQPGGWNAR